MANPHAHLISRYVGWEWFGTLTWKGKVPPQGRRRKLWFAYQYELAALADVSFSSLFWVLRSEQGEKTARHHFHFLLGNSHLSASKSTAFRLMWLWEKRVGGGHARVTRWDPSLNGVEYVTKCLGAGQAAGNLYELDKFRGEEIELSRSFVSWAERRAKYIRDEVMGETDRTPVVIGADAPRLDQETVASGQGERPF